MPEWKRKRFREIPITVLPRLFVCQKCSQRTSSRGPVRTLRKSGSGDGSIERNSHRGEAAREVLIVEFNKILTQINSKFKIIPYFKFKFENFLKTCVLDSAFLRFQPKPEDEKAPFGRRPRHREVEKQAHRRRPPPKEVRCERRHLPQNVVSMPFRPPEAGAFRISAMAGRVVGCLGIPPFGNVHFIEANRLESRSVAEASPTFSRVESIHCCSS